jgi:hypothetical protein
MVIDGLEASARQGEPEVLLPQLDLPLGGQHRHIVGGIEVAKEIGVLRIIKAMRDAVETIRGDAGGGEAVADAAARKGIGVLFERESLFRRRGDDPAVDEKSRGAVEALHHAFFAGAQIRVPTCIPHRPVKPAIPKNNHEHLQGLRADSLLKNTPLGRPAVGRGRHPSFAAGERDISVGDWRRRLMIVLLRSHLSVFFSPRRITLSYRAVKS